MFAKWRAFGVALALTLSVGFAWAQVSTIGGLPSRPQFQGVTIHGTGARDLFINSTDAPVNERLYRFRNNGGGELQLCAMNDALSSASCFLTTDRTGETVVSINLQATAVQANGVPIATAESGSFLISGTSGWSAPPTNCTWYWSKVGNSVTLGFPNSCVGTSNSASGCTFGPLPVALRPARAQVMFAVVHDNGVAGGGTLQISGSDVFCTRHPFGTGFTASGSKGFGGSTVTYFLN